MISSPGILQTALINSINKNPILKPQKPQYFTWILFNSKLGY